ncbi:MAG: hypothetical protein U9Q07_01760 [Planctomycetota bacterium]|nr:hypothetical protein [Planctomycetota bacterium]
MEKPIEPVVSMSESTLRSRFHANLIMLKTERGCSIPELHRIIVRKGGDVSEGTVGAWCRGEALPGTGSQFAIAAALGVTRDDLFAAERGE